MAEQLPRIGSAVLVKKNNTILLARRKKEPNFGKWVIPGGKIEPFESIKQAGEREILEETGLQVRITEQIGVFEIIEPQKEHRIIIYSWAEFLGGELKASSDIFEPKFVKKIEVRSLELSEIVTKVLRLAKWI